MAPPCMMPTKLCTSLVCEVLVHPVSAGWWVDRADLKHNAFDAKCGIMLVRKMFVPCTLQPLIGEI